MRDWICEFGPPILLIHDNGGEDVNETMTTFADRFNIRVTTTAAYAPFSNGIVERHNRVLKLTMNKIGDDVKRKCLTSNAKLAYAVMANGKEQSPRKIWLHTVSTGLRQQSICHSIEDPIKLKLEKKFMIAHFKDFSKMRQKYCEAGAKVNFKQTMKGRQPDTVHMKEVAVGDFVHYHRDGNKDQRGRRGPARVIGSDGQNVIIKHSGKVVNSHPKDVRKFRSQLKHEEAWMENLEKGKMTNEAQNEKAQKRIKTQVLRKTKTQLRKLHVKSVAEITLHT